jgi:hypothetical protein
VLVTGRRARRLQKGEWNQAGREGREGRREGDRSLHRDGNIRGMEGGREGGREAEETYHALGDEGSLPASVDKVGFERLGAVLEEATTHCVCVW